MTAERQETLLAHLLDDELTDPEAEELSSALRQNPALAADASRELALWELFEQQHNPERHGEAFVRACRTRILAESDAPEFVRRTSDRLRAESSRPATNRPRQQGTDTLTQALFVLKVIAARWRVALASAACLISFIALAFWLLPPTSSRLVLSAVKGQVTIQRAGETIAASSGAPLQAGDVVRTAPAATAEISFAPENTLISISPGTELTFASLPKQKKLLLATGKLEATVARQRPFHPMLIATPQAEARVLGTKLILTVRTNSTQLNVEEGKVRFTRLEDHTHTDVSADHYTTAFAGETNIAMVALPKTGRILREFWTNLPGREVNDLLEHPDYPTRPSGRDYRQMLELPAQGTTNYGCRLVGYLHPPITGDYLFWIAASPEAAFNLSLNEDPSDAVRVFGYFFASEIKPRQWEAQSSPRTKSTPIHLVAGRRYYIEVLHKGDDHGGHLAIAWTPPGGEREIISGEFLSPYKPTRKEKKP